MKTEQKKMLSGEMYLPWDAKLTQDRVQAKELCFQLNQTSPTQSDVQ
ncbi:maltose acetyltransferase domain-containing protein [Marinomonas sp. 2405UD68-3]